MIPTGSSDPFALRRAAQGVVKILVEGKLRSAAARPAAKATSRSNSFFEERVKFYFQEIRGFKYDEVNAAMAAGWSNLLDLEERLDAASRTCAPRPISSRLAASFKRIRNILKQAKFDRRRAAVDPRCSNPVPRPIFTIEYRRIAGPADSRPLDLASLRPKVDLFFDKVLVNAPDPRVRQNRLTLLDTLLREFSTDRRFFRNRNQFIGAK